MKHKLKHDEMRRVLVTGATSGIGQELCYVLKDKCHLIVIGSNLENLNTLSCDLGIGHTAICADLECSDGIARLNTMLPKNVTDFVHCAGKEFLAPIATISSEQFSKYFNLHVFSYISIIKLLASRKKIHDEFITNVVLMSSIASHDGGAMQSLYSSSKAAAEALSKPLSRELNRKKFRINALQAGLVDTPMTERWAKKLGIRQISDLQLNGTISTRQIADLVQFLLNEESRHINGSTIRIDGGGALSSLS